MSKGFCTADEIAWAVCVAYSMNKSLHKHEVGKGPEWIVQRAALAPQGKPAASSRTAVYAYLALISLRRYCSREAIAGGLGYASQAAASGALSMARNAAWWDAALAIEIRLMLAKKIDRVAPPVMVDSEEPRPTPKADPVDKRADSFTPRRVTALGAVALKVDHLPAPRRAGVHKPLSSVEKAVNAALLGDPPPGRSALDQGKGAA